MITRPRRESNDIFFLNGDRLALQTSDSILISYVDDDCDDDDVDVDHDHTTNAGTSKNNHRMMSVPQHEFNQDLDEECYVIKQNSFLLCQQQDYYKCRSCHQVYSNEHLLDIHLYECHDVFFKMALEKQQRQQQQQRQSTSAGLYKCLIQNCPCKFYSDQERNNHLIQHHQYPNWFRFHSRKETKKKKMVMKKNMIKKADVESDINRTSSINTNSIDDIKNKKKWWYHKRKDYNSSSITTDVDNTIPTIAGTYRDKNKDNDTDDDDDDDDNMSTTSIVETTLHQSQSQSISQDVSSTMISSESYTPNTATTTNTTNEEKILQQKEMKMKERKERKKIKNATIPCRFYNSKGGCWRGDKCMFLHAKIGKNKNHNDTSDNINDNNENKIMKNEETMETMDKNDGTMFSDMDVCQEIDNTLVNEMKTKVRIGNVPNKISFGRTRKRR